MEVVQVGQKDRRLDELVHAAAGRLEDRAEIHERLFGLRADAVADRLGIVGLDPDLPSHEHESIRLDRL